jgi:hypothetical protein
MIDAGGTVPGSVDVVFHVGVVGEELAILVEVAAVNVTVTGSVEFEFLAVARDAVNDAAGSEAVAVVAAAIRHAREEVIVCPDLGDGRAVGSAGDETVADLSVVAGDEVEVFSVGGGDDGVDAVIAPGLESAQELHLVEFLVAVGVADLVEAALGNLFVVVDAGVDGAVDEDHAVDGADVDGDFFDVLGLEGFAGGGRSEDVEDAILVAGVDAALVVGAERDPGTLIPTGDGVDEFDLEALAGGDAVDGGGFALANGGAGGLRAAAFIRSG